MQTLKEKYQAWKKRKEEKSYEEWKQSQSGSSVKNGLRFAFFLPVVLTLHRFAEKYFYDEAYEFNDLKEDFVFIFIFSLFGGVIVAYSINRKFQKRMREEIAGGKFSG